MKKFLLIILILIFSLNVFSDVIPPNSHYLDKCVKINNLNDFPNYVFVAKITGPIIESGHNKIKLIKENTCLKKGYKFNKFELFAVKKSYFDSVKKIDFSNENVFPSNIEINPYGGYVSNFDARIKEKIIYSVKEIKNHKLILVEANTVVDSNSFSFFNAIICFFTSLFGGKC